jgi:transposase
MRNGCVDLPRGLSIPFKGNLKWIREHGRLEVSWDALSKKWRVFQSVVVKPLITPLGSKTCYIDLGVRNLATVWIPEWRQPIAFQSGHLLADWWYWTNRIAQHQQRLISVNGRKKSKRLLRRKMSYLMPAGYRSTRDYRLVPLLVSQPTKNLDGLICPIAGSSTLAMAIK